MKRKIGIVLVAILAVSMIAATFTACSNSSPESVVKAYIDASNKGKVSKMVDCFYFETKAEKEATKAMLELAYSLGGGSEEKMETRKFSTEKDGDTAIVTFEYREKGSGDDWEEMSMACIKEGGKWYLDYSALFGSMF